MNNNNEIAPWKDSKWLVLSSFYFMIPCIYSFYNKLYSFSLVLLLTSLISANYWRKATYSFRRNLDLCFARISFVIFVSNGIIYVRSIPFIITGYSGLIMLFYCYYYSDFLFKKQSIYWVNYHMLFHLIMMYEQMIIINSILHHHK